MLRLLRASARRYLKSVIFWLSLAVLGVFGVLGAWEIGPMETLDDFYLLALMLMFAAMIALNVGKELGDGTVRCRIVAGYTKGQIFFSELILALGLCLVMFLVTAAPFLIVNYPIFKTVPAQVTVKTVIGIVMLSLAVAALCVTVCCLISHKAVSAVTAMMLVIGMIFGGIFLYQQLDYEEYFYGYTYNELGEQKEVRVKNSNYVDEPLRSVYKLLYRLTPTGQIMEYAEIMSPYFTPHSVKLEVPAKEIRTLNTAPLYSLGIIVAVSCAGYIIFRKKNIK